MVYKWKATGFNADANLVGKELDTIEELTAKKVVEKARDVNTELHKCFEWNESIAAEKYRLCQANDILTSIAIVISEEKATRKYVSIKTKEDKRVFKDIINVLQNDEEYSQVIAKAEQDFISYRTKYEDLIELNDLKNIIFRNIR